MSDAPEMQLPFMVRDDRAGTMRDLTLTLPITITQWGEWQRNGLTMLVHMEIEGDIDTARRLLGLFHWAIGGTTFATTGEMLESMLRTRQAITDFIERRDRDPGHARLLIEEAKHLAYQSPELGFLQALRIIDDRESQLAVQRIIYRRGESFERMGRAIGDAMAMGIESMHAATSAAKELTEGEDTYTADERRYARVCASTTPRRPASDPAFHRWHAWRDRNGVAAGRRLPPIRNRGAQWHR